MCEDSEEEDMLAAVYDPHHQTRDDIFTPEPSEVTSSSTEKKSPNTEKENEKKPSTRTFI